MPFSILDNDEAFNTTQSIWMQTDINALVAGIGADGVLTGCTVTAQGSPDMTLAVAAGEVLVSGTKALVTAGNVTITTADATNPRIDLVVVNSSGTKSVTAGTAAASPKAPDIPASSVLLAMVYVPAGDTAIQSNQITDKRVVVRPLLARARLVVSGTTYFCIPGVNISALGTGTTGLGPNYVQYQPFLVETPITVDALQCEVTTAGTAGNSAHLGIYHADESFLPTTLVVDSGNIAVDSTGVKTVSGLSIQLQPGRYVQAFQSESGTFRTFRGENARLYGLLANGNGFVASVYQALTYGAFPSTATTPTNVAGNSSPGNHFFLLRVSDPTP